MKTIALWAAVALAPLASGATWNSFAENPGNPLPFSPELVLTFDDLTPGQVINPGDAIAPGVTFLAPAGYSNVKALVVDLGGGDMALRMMHADEQNAVNPSAIAFYFDTAIDSFAADWNRVTGQNFWDGGDGNPAASIFASNGSYVYAGQVGGTMTSFVGGAYDFVDMPNEAHYLLLDISSSGSNSLWDINNVAINAVPTPGAVGLLALGGLAGVRRRR